jgi:hypothetical protein
MNLLSSPQTLRTNKLECVEHSSLLGRNVSGKPSQPKLLSSGMSGSNQSGAPFSVPLKSRLFAALTNIGLGFNGFAGTNAIAYWTGASMTKKSL